MENKPKIKIIFNTSNSPESIKHKQGSPIVGITLSITLSGLITTGCMILSILALVSMVKN